MRQVGERVLVFTTSGTFRGHPGVVVLAARGCAIVKLDGEREMFFKDREMVPEADGSRSHVGGAE